MSVPDTAQQLLENAAFRTRPDLGVVRVSGDDRSSWLNGQITNDVRNLSPGTGVHALAVNVRGKIISELWVTAHASELLIVVPSAAQSALLESFERYIIMEDVTLEPLAAVRVLSLEGPRSQVVQALINHGPEVIGFAHTALNFPAYAWLGPAPELEAIADQLLAHASAIEPESYELARLRRASPRFGIDFDEHHYPQEAGLKDQVSFNKGCYLGQEVVCTLESRGRLSRHLVSLRGAPGAVVEPGAQLALTANSDAKAGDDAHETVGTVTSVAWDPALGTSLALGYVRRTHAAVGTVLLAGTQQLTIDKRVGEPSSAPASTQQSAPGL